MRPRSILVSAISLLSAYLIGAIPFGIVVARVIGGPDPRSLGSGRTGGANAVRALGPRAGVAAGLLDAGKGSVSVIIPTVLGAGPLTRVVSALVAILGHSRSIYIGFGGGRGVAPAFGGLLVIQPVIAVLTVPVFVIVLALSRISSLASLTASSLASVALLGAVVLRRLHPAYAVYSVVASAMIWLFHHDNVKRLLEGRERRIEWRR